MSAFTSFAAATRATRRDMFRSPWRLIAAVLLIALPVAVAVGASLTGKSSTDVYSKEAQAIDVDSYNQVCSQDALGRLFDCAKGSDSVEADVLSKEQITKGLPAGFSVEPFIESMAEVVTEGPIDTLHVQQVPHALLADNLPVIPRRGEVILPKSVAARNLIEVGDAISLKLTDHPSFDGLNETTKSSGQAKVTVAGFAPGIDALVGPDTFASTASLLGTPASAHMRWVLVGPRALEWSEVETANSQRLNFYSQLWHHNPPAGAPQPHVDEPTSYAHSGGDRMQVLREFYFYAFLLALYGIGFFLLLLFISPVFSLAIARHTRLFALMAAQGASRTHIGWAVLIFGLFAGLIGTALGEILGHAYAWISWMIRYPGWSVREDWLWVIGAAVVAVVGSVLTAAVPAWLAGRASLSGAMLGGSPDKMVRWRPWMLIGPVIVVCTAIITILISLLSKSNNHWGWVYILAFVCLIGLAASAPALIFGAGKVCAAGPVALRLAARGFTRRSMHAIPMVAALSCLTLLVTGTTVTSDADSLRYQRVKEKVLPTNIALVSTYDSKGVEASVALLNEHLGAPAATIDIRGVLDVQSEWDYYDDRKLPAAGAWHVYSTDAENCDYNESIPPQVVDSAGRLATEDPEAARACLAKLSESGSYFYGLPLRSGVWVGGDELLETLVFSSAEDKDRARQTLNAGGVLVNQGIGLDGVETTRFNADHFSTLPEQYEQLDNPDNSTSATLPVADVLSQWTPGSIILSPQAAAKLGLTTTELGKAFVYDEPITGHDSQLIQQGYANAVFGNDGHPTQDMASIYTTDNQAPLSDLNQWKAAGALSLAGLVLLVLVIALAAAGNRHEHSVLSSLGAMPHFGAKVAAWQTGLLAALALWVGIIGGHLGALAIATHNKISPAGQLYSYGNFESLRLNVTFVVVGLALPLLAAGVAWCVHARGGQVRGPEERSLA